MDDLSESEIREVLRVFARRLSANESDALLVEEVTVNGGKNRIDMLYFGETTVGIEIKSARDDLSRLPAQAESFSQYFEYMILVTDSRFVSRAIEMLPKWWGVFEISKRENRTKLVKVREPSQNPSVQSESLLEFLWKSELLSLLEKIRQPESNSRLAKKDLRKELVCNADSDELKQWSLNAILERRDWRGIRLQKAC